MIEPFGVAAPIVPFDAAADRLCPFDLTGAAGGPDAATVADIPRFSAWIDARLRETGGKYGIGGYGENRIIYASKAHFGQADEARSLHLGVDIWGPAGTPVHTPFDATVHSFAFNDRFGDYGATIILEHRSDAAIFYSLYGHLSLASIAGLSKGRFLGAGAAFAAFGTEPENGHWPPHLHFQLIADIGGREGDYPGVCKPSEKDRWLANSPDPAPILAYTFGGANALTS